MDQKNIERLLTKKKELQNEIHEIRKRKHEINEALDFIWNHSGKHRKTDEGASKLINELYSLNIKLNEARDKVDEINKRLRTKSELSCST